MSNNTYFRGGFSLAELMSVAVVILIVIGLLVPGGASDQREQRKQACLGHLRELSRLAAAYAADDPQQVIGPVHPESAGWVGEGYADYGGGPGTMYYMGWKPPVEASGIPSNANNDFDPRTRPLNLLLYGHNGIVANTIPGDMSVYRVFQCPGEDLGWQLWPSYSSDPRETENSYFEANGTSFRLNNLAFTVGSARYVGVYGHSQNRIPSASSTLLFLEARVYQTLFTNESWGSLTRGELIGYHGKIGFFNASYVDGHAAFTDFGQGTYYAHDPNLGGLDARGLWGQMDCLPEYYTHN